MALDRIDTIADPQAAARYGVKTNGNAEGATAEVLAELAHLIADGTLAVTQASRTNGPFRHRWWVSAGGSGSVRPGWRSGMGHSASTGLSPA